MVFLKTPKQKVEEIPGQKYLFLNFIPKVYYSTPVIHKQYTIQGNIVGGFRFWIFSCYCPTFYLMRIKCLQSHRIMKISLR